MAPPVGLEPTTLRLTAACSTDWAKEEYSIFKKFAFWICLSYPNSIIWFPVCYRTVRSTDWAKEEYLISLDYYIIPYYEMLSTHFLKIFLVTRMGIEPMLPAWEAGVLTAWPTSLTHTILSYKKRVVNNIIRDFWKIIHKKCPPKNNIQRTKFNAIWNE